MTLLFMNLIKHRACHMALNTGLVSFIHSHQLVTGQFNPASHLLVKTPKIRHHTNFFFSPLSVSVSMI